MIFSIRDVDPLPLSKQQQHQQQHQQQSNKKQPERPFFAYCYDYDTSVRQTERTSGEVATTATTATATTTTTATTITTNRMTKRRFPHS